MFWFVVLISVYHLSKQHESLGSENWRYCWKRPHPRAKHYQASCDFRNILCSHLQIFPFRHSFIIREPSIFWESGLNTKQLWLRLYLLTTSSVKTELKRRYLILPVVFAPPNLPQDARAHVGMVPRILPGAGVDPVAVQLHQLNDACGR